MRMYRICCLILALCALVSPSLQSDKSEQFLKCFPNNKLSSLDPQVISAQLAKSRLKFSIDFMKKVWKQTEPDDNFFFSPHSIYQALLLTLFISNDHTEKHIKTALQLPATIDKLDVLQAFKLDSEFDKMRSLNGSASYEVRNVNRFFFEKSLSVRDCIEKLFHDELAPLDFKEQPAQSVHQINEWVSNQTKYQIKEILTDSDLSEESKLVLVNAMYFKGLWASKFLPENTKKDVFYWREGNKLVPMMKQKGNFRYLISEELRSHVIQMPYKGEDITMFILLPPFVDPHSIEYLFERLNADTIEKLVEPSYMSERPVELEVPKFTVEHKLKNLVPILQSMGVGDLFNKSADLSSFTGNRDIFFSDATHKAKVSIDENGTVAAAATAVFTFRSSRPLEPIKFRCNHPFIYFIYDNVSQSILFIGVYKKPV